MSKMQVNAQCQVYFTIKFIRISILPNRNRTSGAPAHRKALKSTISTTLVYRHSTEKTVTS